MAVWDVDRPGWDSLSDLGRLAAVQADVPLRVSVVHGLWSSPLTWTEMFNDLRSNPDSPSTHVERGNAGPKPRPRASPPESTASARPRISSMRGRQGSTEARSSTTRDA